MMNKEITRRVVLAALLMSALVFMGMPGSVRFFDTVAQTAASYSYFEINVEAASTAIVLPLAGFVVLVAVILAVVNLFLRKDFLERTIMWTSMAAALLSVAPMLFRQEGVLLVTHVMPVILLLVVWQIGYITSRKKEKAEQSGVPDNALRR